jgi:desulfoferrodoxin (superoxide reductase-like protein)
VVVIGAVGFVPHPNHHIAGIHLYGADHCVFGDGSRPSLIITFLL